MTDEEIKQKKTLSQKQDKLTKDEAYKELLLVRQSNRGSSRYEDIQMVVKKYNNPSEDTGTCSSTKPNNDCITFNSMNKDLLQFGCPKR